MVIGNQLSEKYVGTWRVNVVSEYFDPKGRYHKFENSFNLEVWNDEEIETQETVAPIEEDEEEAAVAQLDPIDFDGLVIKEP